MSRLSRYGRYTHLRVIFRDLFRLNNEIYPDEYHLRAAMEWLCKAQDSTGCDGVSAGYIFGNGWNAPYPETTGYIIPTFLQYALSSGDGRFIERAIAMGDWEIEIQLPSGAVRGGVGINEYPIVFNTGQVVLGWISLYSKTKQNKFLDAAIRAADWLISIQDGDGKWRKHTYNNVPHAYHTRVAWPLLELYKVTNNERFRVAAEKNIIWSLSQSKEYGWFSKMGFTDDEAPLTHTIAYTLRGLIESYFFLVGEIKEKVLEIVQTASESIIRRYGFGNEGPYAKSMYLPARLDEDWKSKADYSCLTGNVQLSIIWMKLYSINGDTQLINAASEMIDQVKSTQSLHSKNPGIMGGIAGSYPIWGGYNPFSYLNWSTKFFADSIMMRKLIK